MPTVSLPSTGLTCLATATCEPSLPPAGIGQSISSAAGSRAKTSALRARVPASPGQGLVFGTSSLGSLGSYDPATSLWRTSQLSLLGGWEPFSATFPRSGMTRSGTLFQLQPLVRRTAGKESGLWPTPRVSDIRDGRKLNENGRRVSPSGVYGANLADIVKVWPTPTARDWKSGKGKTQAERGRSHGQSLAEANGGQLNPTWVEWLMGFPLGWTDLGGWATPSSRKSSKSSAGRSLTQKQG